MKILDCLLDADAACQKYVPLIDEHINCLLDLRLLQIPTQFGALDRRPIGHSFLPHHRPIAQLTHFDQVDDLLLAEASFSFAFVFVDFGVNLPIVITDIDCMS